MKTEIILLGFIAGFLITDKVLEAVNTESGCPIYTQQIEYKKGNVFYWNNDTLWNDPLYTDFNKVMPESELNKFREAK